MTKRYYIYNNTGNITLSSTWDSSSWRDVEAARIDHVHPKSSSHHPVTTAKLQYNKEGIFVLFRVEDKFVKSVHTNYNAKVNEDSCVEWFIKPENAEGYYNFEINAGGTLHVNYIVDPQRDEYGKRKDIRSISEDHARQVRIKSSLPNKIDPEIAHDIVWTLALYIPFSFFELYTPIKKINGSIWQGNLYKCGDKTSHPHWIMWNPVNELNFHQPKHFGEFVFKSGKDI